MTGWASCTEHDQVNNPIVITSQASSEAQNALASRRAETTAAAPVPQRFGGVVLNQTTTARVIVFDESGWGQVPAQDFREGV